MYLNIATDDELLVSQVVKFILMLILVITIIFNLFKSIKAVSLIRRIINIFLFLSFSVALYFVIREFRIEGALLEHPVYVEGTTIGYCSVFARGTGIEFEYELGGKKYKRCNTFYPVPKDSIQVPGGKYKVRCSEKFRDSGRMIFTKRNS